MSIESSKYAVDAVSFGVILGTLADWLPAAAALVSIIWTLIRIYETKTVQRFIARRRGLPVPGEGSKHGD